MKLPLFPLAGLVPALLIVSVHGQAVGVPVLSTPGSATWLSEITSTGTKLTFTITGDTVLDWGQFNLGSGNELIFDFVGGTSVTNMLNGTSTNTIAGSVTSNGNVGFFSPNAPLTVTGSVTANNVTLATMDVDPQAFNSGGNFTMTAGSGGALTVRGSVTATNGSVVLAGQTVRLHGSGIVQASDAVRVGGGQQVNVETSGLGRRLKASGQGFVLHMGESHATRIEVAAGSEINVGGTLDAGSSNNRIFLEVGKGGQILREGAGLMIGRTAIRGRYLKDGIPVSPNTDDVRAAVNTSTVKMPALKRPDGSSVSSSRTLVNDVPMSASADSGRDRKRANAQVVSNDKAKPLVQRASFFGMRGGSEKKER